MECPIGTCSMASNVCLCITGSMISVLVTVEVWISGMSDGTCSMASKICANL